MALAHPPALLESIQQYQRAYDKAIELFSLFEDAESRELLRLHEALADDVKRFLNVSGLDWEHCGNLGRHLTFLGRYLKQNEKESCAQDVKDIVFFDLPTALRNLISQSSEDAHLDQRWPKAL